MGQSTPDSWKWRCPPLTDFRRYIRLLRVHPLNSYDYPDPEVCCSIAEYPIDNLPSYFAISYACGDRNDVETIEIEDKQAVTFATLTQALRSLRRQRALHAPILVWADALCIHQNDLVEKTAQVALMGKIYGNATDVVIWLGDEDELGRNLFPETQERLNWNMMLPSPQFKEKMLRLLEQPWWSRLWCYQELCLAANGFFLWGLRAAPISEVLASVESFIKGMYVRDSKWSDSFEMSNWFLGEGAVDTIQAAVRLYLKRKSEPTHHVDLIDLLLSFKAAQCSDPRDRIFASLSLASDKTLVSKNAPSYGLTLRKVYARFAASTIENTGRLHILNYCTKSTNLPTWTPDWRNAKKPRWPIIKTPSPSRRIGFNACGDTLAEYSIDEAAISKPRTISLRAHGFVLDVIRTIGTFANISNCDSPESDPLPEWRALAEDEFGVNRFKEKLLLFWDTLFASGAYQADQYRTSIEDGCNVRHRLLADFVESGAKQWPQDEVFQKVLKRCSGRRSFFVTDKGYMGISLSAWLQINDKVCILSGGPTPYVIEKAGISVENDAYELVGQCYLSGYMYGEAMDELQQGLHQMVELEFV